MQSIEGPAEPAAIQLDEVEGTTAAVTAATAVTQDVRLAASRELPAPLPKQQSAPTSTAASTVTPTVTPDVSPAVSPDVTLAEAPAKSESAPAPQGKAGGGGGGKLVQVEARSTGRIGVTFFIQMAAAAGSTTVTCRLHDGYVTVT